MKIVTDDLAADIHVAEIDRALGLVARAWEDTDVLDIGEMCEHLEAVNDIVIKEINFAEFVETTNLSSHERLN